MDAVDSQFFTAYADVNVHQIMLKDQARNEAYWAALQAHAKGKVVLDVGSGTGFLSILAARAGAAHVYAVEASDMAEVSKDIIDDNMLSDCITVITGRIEDVSLPCMVDIIVSEWMGFYLVHESMMRSVLIARDRFLKPDGIMLPESADIYCAPANCDGDVQSNISWWSEGVLVGKGLSAVKLDFSAMSSLAVVKMLSQPHVQVVNPSQLLADAVKHSSFDMRSATAAAVDRALATAPRMSWCLRSELPVHAIAVWFSCSFPGGSAVLDTSPFAAATHWKQTLVYLRNMYGGVANATFSARLSLMCDEDNCRQYIVNLQTESEDEDAGQDSGSESES